MVKQKFRKEKGAQLKGGAKCQSVSRGVCTLYNDQNSQKG